MFWRSFRRVKSQSVSARPVQIESLEGRQLLSATVASDVLGLDGNVNTQSFSPMNFVTESVNPIKVEGTFAGHYVSKHYGKNTLVITITHDTHTGHFVGNAVINTDQAVGTLSGTVKGVVKVSKHIDVTVTGNGYSATFTGTASHTGGSFYGSYSISGSGLSDTGTYHVGKA